MKFCLVFLATILFLSPFMLHYSFAEKGTFVDEVKFIQYLDENTALEEIPSPIDTSLFSASDFAFL